MDPRSFPRFQTAPIMFPDRRRIVELPALARSPGGLFLCMASKATRDDGCWAPSYARRKYRSFGVNPRRQQGLTAPTPEVLDLFSAERLLRRSTAQRTRAGSASGLGAFPPIFLNARVKALLSAKARSAAIWSTVFPLMRSLGHCSGIDRHQIGEADHSRVLLHPDPQGGAEGMIINEGGRFGGYGLYFLKSKPVFVWNLLLIKRMRWEGPALSPGKHTIVFDFKYDGPRRGDARLQRPERRRPRRNGR